MRQEQVQTKTGTYYQILDVEADAHTEMINLSFRRLAKVYHPDHNSASDAMGKMQDLNSAYSVLKNRAARQAYDSSLADKVKSSVYHFDDWHRNGALMICMMVLASLIYQFIDPPVHVSALSTDTVSNELVLKNRHIAADVDEPIAPLNNMAEPLQVLRVEDVIDLGAAHIDVDMDATVLQIPPTSTAIPTPRPTAMPTQTPSALAFTPTAVP